MDQSAEPLPVIPSVPSQEETSAVDIPQPQQPTEFVQPIDQPNPIPPTTQEYIYAPHFRRFVAASLDGTVVSFIGTVVTQILKTGIAGDPNAFASKTLDTLIKVLFSAFYFIWYWTNRNGQTPGKRLMHIRIIKDTGEPIDIKTAIIRYVSEIVSYISLFIGVLWIIFDKKHQSWRDKIAHTYVVDVNDGKPSDRTVLAYGCLLPIGVLIIGIIVGILNKIPHP